MYKVKAVTRNKDSEKAKYLESVGCEVVSGDYGDLDSLVKAFTGAYGVYCVTNFWEHMSAEKETQQAKNLALACEKANVSHVVWSTLEDTREHLNKVNAPKLQGNYTTPHFDAKYEANSFFKNLPTTYLYTTFYYDNFINFGQGPKKTDSGDYAIYFNMGNENMAMVALEDIGKAVAEIFGNSSLIGQNYFLASDSLSCSKIAELFSKHLNITCKYVAMDDKTFRGLGFPGAEEIGNMFAFYRLNLDFAKKRFQEGGSNKGFNNLKDTKRFERWLIENKGKFPLK